MAFLILAIFGMAIIISSQYWITQTLLEWMHKLGAQTKLNQIYVDRYYISMTLYYPLA